MAKIIPFTPRKRDASALPAGHSAEIVTLPVAAKASRAIVPVDIIAEMRLLGLVR